MRLKPVKPVPVRLNEMPDILTRADLAQILQVKPRAIYSLTRARAKNVNPLPVLRLPIGLRWRRQDVESWLERCAA